MTPQERVTQAEVERLNLLPHPVGALTSEGRIPGSVMRAPIQWDNWVAPQWVEALRSLATLPGDTAAGQEIPISRVHEAGLTALGGGRAIGTVPKGALGMFAGRSAEGAPLKQLSRAKELSASQPGRDVWQDTQVFQDLDGQMKWEIPDQATRVNQTWRDWLTNRVHIDSPRPLKEILEAPDLYKAYPDLQDVTVSTPPWMSKGEAGYNPQANAISLHPTDKNSTRLLLLHEIQHWIQEREGWAQGAAINQFIKPEQIARGQRPQTLQEHLVEKGLLQQEELLFDDATARIVAERAAKKDSRLADWLKEYDDVSASAHSLYQRVAGEVLARLTSRRADLNPTTRKQIYPPSQFDVPLEDQIMRLGGEIYPRWPHQ